MLLIHDIGKGCCYSTKKKNCTSSALLLQTFRDVQKTEAQEFACSLLQLKSKNNKNIIYIARGVSVQELVKADIFLLQLRSPSAHL